MYFFSTRTLKNIKHERRNTHSAQQQIIFKTHAIPSFRKLKDYPPYIITKTGEEMGSACLTLSTQQNTHDLFMQEGRKGFMPKTTPHLPQHHTMDGGRVQAEIRQLAI
jgi:hypothetical protein